VSCHGWQAQRPDIADDGAVVGDRVFEHGCRHGEDNAGRAEAATRQDVVDQEAMDSAVAVFEGVDEDESVGQRVEWTVDLRLSYGVNAPENVYVTKKR